MSCICVGALVVVKGNLSFLHMYHHRLAYKPRTTQRPTSIRCKKALHIPRAVEIALNVADTTSVDPEFITTLLNSVCRQHANTPDTLQTCISMLKIPPLEEQIAVMDTLRQLNEAVDIEPVVGTMMQILLAHDMETAKLLIHSLLDYEISSKQIQSIIELYHVTLPSQGPAT